MGQQRLRQFGTLAAALAAFLHRHREIDRTVLARAPVGTVEQGHQRALPTVHLQVAQLTRERQATGHVFGIDRRLQTQKARLWIHRHRPVAVGQQHAHRPGTGCETLARLAIAGQRLRQGPVATGHDVEQQFSRHRVVAQAQQGLRGQESRRGRRATCLWARDVQAIGELHQRAVRIAVVHAVAGVVLDGGNLTQNPLLWLGLLGSRVLLLRHRLVHLGVQRRAHRTLADHGLAQRLPRHALGLQRHQFRGGVRSTRHHVGARVHYRQAQIRNAFEQIVKRLGLIRPARIDLAHEISRFESHRQLPMRGRQRGRIRHARHDAVDDDVHAAVLLPRHHGYFQTRAQQQFLRRVVELARLQPAHRMGLHVAHQANQRRLHRTTADGPCGISQGQIVRVADVARPHEASHRGMSREIPEIVGVRTPVQRQDLDLLAGLDHRVLVGAALLARRQVQHRRPQRHAAPGRPQTEGTLRHRWRFAVRVRSRRHPESLGMAAVGQLQVTARHQSRPTAQPRQHQVALTSAGHQRRLGAQAQHGLHLTAGTREILQGVEVRPARRRPPQRTGRLRGILQHSGQVRRVDVGQGLDLLARHQEQAAVDPNVHVQRPTHPLLATGRHELRGVREAGQGVVHLRALAVTFRVGQPIVRGPHTRFARAQCLRQSRSGNPQQHDHDQQAATACQMHLSPASSQTIFLMAL